MQLFRVIIIDDENLFREYLRSVIDWKEYGFEIIAEAKDGEEAYKKILELQPDLIFTDINMPVMDGLELIAALQEKKRDFLSVIITGYSEFEYARTAIKLGVEDFLLKPFDKSELEALIAKIKPGLLQRKTTHRFPEDVDFMRKFIRISMENGFASLEKEDIERIYQYCDSFLYDSYAEIQLKNLNECLHMIASDLKQSERLHVQSILKYLYEETKRLDADTASIILLKVLLFAFDFILSEYQEISIFLGHDFPLYVPKNPMSEDLYHLNVLVYDKIIDSFSLQTNVSFKKLAGTIKKYIDEHYKEEEISTGRIAKELYLDDSYIRKAFKQEFGLRVTDYIHRKRLEEALHLIKSRKYKLSEISELLGYKDGNYFNRLFKRYYGISPKEYSIKQDA